VTWGKAKRKKGRDSAPPWYLLKTMEKCRLEITSRRGDSTEEKTQSDLSRHQREKKLWEDLKRRNKVSRPFFEGESLKKGA